MAIRIRTYLLDDNGALKRVPRRVVEGLVFGHDAIIECAGTTRRVLDVLVENENGKAVRILDATGSFWTFDQSGKVDRARWNSALLDLDWDLAGSKREGNVVDLRPEFKRKKFRNKHRWDVTADLLDRIAADIWPSLAAEPVPQIGAVKGTAPKRPPLTYEAQNAITEFHGQVSAITFPIDGLSEIALKGLAFEARRIAGQYIEGSSLWAAIAAEADRAREIKARRRTGRGVWYALLRVFRQVDAREMQEIDTLEERCESRAAAAEAAKRLLAENAHRFSEDVTLEAELLSELEWRPIGTDDRLISAR